MARPVQCVAMAGWLGAGQVHTLATTLGESASAARLAHVLSVQQAHRRPAQAYRFASARTAGRLTLARRAHFLHRQAVVPNKVITMRAPHMFERAIAIRDDGQQTLAIWREERHRRFEPCPQARTSARICESSDRVSALGHVV